MRGNQPVIFALPEKQPLTYSERALFCAILIFFVWLAGRDSNPYLSNVADLGAIPDSVDYVLLGEAIAKKGSLALDVNGHRWPIRYPPLLSHLIAPLYFLRPQPEQVAAIAPILIGCAGLMMAFMAMRKMLGIGTAIIFMALLASSPLLQTTSWMVLTEPAALLLGGGILIFVLREINAESLSNRFCLGVLAGLFVLLKLSAIFILFAAALSLGTLYPPRKLVHALQIAIPFGAVASLFLIYNAALFGDPFITGYEWYVGTSGFTLEALNRNLADVARLMLAQPVQIVGIRWPGLALGMPLLAVGGAIAIKGRFGWRPAAAVVSFALLSSLPFLFYAFSDLRFHLPLITCVYGLTAAFFGLVVMPWFSRLLGPAGALMTCILIAVVWPGFGQSSAFAFAGNFYERNWRAEKYLLFAEFQKIVVEHGRPAALLSGLYLPLAARWAGPSVQVYPIDHTHCFASCRAWVAHAFNFDLDDLSKSYDVYLTNVDLKPQRFEEICNALFQRYVLKPLPTPSRWQLYLIKERTAADWSYVCPKAE